MREETNCPSRNQLITYLSETEVAEETIVRHVESCRLCQACLDRLTDSAELAFYHQQKRARQDANRHLGPPNRDGDLGSLDGLAIEKQIGSGGMGVVFRGRDEKLGRLVAIKILTRHGSGESAARFEREFRAAAKLEHEHLVGVYSASRTADGIPYIVMPLVEGESLADRIVARQSLPNRDAAELVRQIALGLFAAHSAGVIHRDVKPANILIGQKDHRARLTDFGLVRGNDDATLTAMDILAGTPAYMSPEQIADSRSCDARSDIYSLGITLYECLTGTTPFRGQPIQVLEQHRNVEPISPSRLNPNIPLDLANICLMAIAKEPARRYQNCWLFAEDLQRFLDGRPVVARETTSLVRLRMWCGRNRALATSLALLFLALVLGTTGTTAMWITSSRNASEALNYANDLEQNRTRLRESVSRFQKRVFSDQAMHFQMPDAFRAEMFADVISYLDEFAILDTPENADRSETDELTSDYLMVAEAALDVDRYDDAITAADRALLRIRKLTANADAANGNLYLQFRSARVGYLARHPRSRFYFRTIDNTTASQAVRHRLATECQSVIQRLCENEPDNQLWKQAANEARLMVLASRETLDREGLRELRELYEELASVKNQDNKETMYAHENALNIGWLLSESYANAEAIKVVRRNLEVVEKLRANLRMNKKPFAESDWIKATNHGRLAFLLYNGGDTESAVKHAMLARDSYFNALQQRPQNRIWINESVMLDLLLADWLVEQGNFSAATESLERAAKRSLRLSKSDPDDNQMRKRIVRIFVKYADVSVMRKSHELARKEYFIAAQDCRLLILSDEYRPWALRTRLWLLFRVLSQLELAPDDVFHAKLMEWENSFIRGMKEKFDYDARLFRDVLDGTHRPERPADLEFNRITDDILRDGQ